MYNIHFAPGHGGNCLLFGVKFATRDNTCYMSPFDSFVIVLYANTILPKKVHFQGRWRRDGIFVNIFI